MFNIHLEYDSKLDTFGDRLTVAVTKKLADLTIRMYEKVIENVSGKILQKQSGQLLSSVNLNFGFDGNSRMGEVFISPESPKAWALEQGGERNYTIVPTKATLLRFYWAKVGAEVAFPSVDHPPSKKFGYLQAAFDEMREIVPEELREAIQSVLDGEVP